MSCINERILIYKWNNSEQNMLKIKVVAGYRNIYTSTY